jgi:hypothetical protein
MTDFESIVFVILLTRVLTVHRAIKFYDTVNIEVGLSRRL